MIDKKETDLVLNFTCLLPCNTCLTNSNSKCTSCYTNGSITGLPYLLDYSCLEVCPVSYYVDTSYKC